MIRTEGCPIDSTAGRSLVFMVRAVPVAGGTAITVLHWRCRGNGKLGEKKQKRRALALAGETLKEGQRGNIHDTPFAATCYG